MRARMWINLWWETSQINHKKEKYPTIKATNLQRHLNLISPKFRL